MKAKYQSPKIESLFTSLEYMIALGSPEQGQDLGDAPTTSATEGNLSRRNSVWDDGGDDEEFF